MQLSEVKRLTGLSRKAIDLYEELGMINPGKVSVGVVREYREYTENEINRLKTIAKLRELDMPLLDIKKVLDGENVDIVFQSHLMRQREKMEELRLTLEKVSEVLNRLPPNATHEEMSSILKTVIPSDVDKKLHHKLNDDFSSFHTRRITMLMFETFLDKPFVTKEQWDLWYAILERMEKCITPAMADHYSDVYGRFSTEQLREDYSLRRRLVCAYTNYGPMEEKAKAAEIYTELKQLTMDERLLNQWKNYYCKIVSANRISEEISEMVSRLSTVYDDYNHRFRHMKKHYLDPLLDTEEGALLRETLMQKLGHDILTEYGLIYFDFYNNTYRHLLADQGAEA